MTKTNRDLSELLVKQAGGGFQRAVDEAVLQERCKINKLA